MADIRQIYGRKLKFWSPFEKRGYDICIIIIVESVFGHISAVHLAYDRKSKLSRKLKIILFIAACESILLYGSETWTMTKAQEKSLDGTYTKMLRMVLGLIRDTTKTIRQDQEQKIIIGGTLH